MDWSAAIETNREALRRILTALVAMAGLRGRFAPEAQDCPASGAPTGGEGRDAAGESGDPAGLHSEDHPTLPRHLHRAVLRLLRPAEAAARRLIIVAARDMPAPPPRPRKPAPPAWPHRAKPAGRRARNAHRPSKRHDKARPPKPTAPDGSFSPAARRAPALPLFDTLRPFRAPRRPVAAGVPRISFPGYGTSTPIAPRLPPMPDDPIDATRLALRLRAVAAALDDLPAHASRFARWRARRDAALHPPPRGEGRREAAGWGSCTVAPRPAIPRSAPVARPSFELPQGRGWKGRVWPLRPGRPPGWRAAGRRSHPVHDLLVVVHDLAFWAMERSDTS